MIRMLTVFLLVCLVAVPSYAAKKEITLLVVPKEETCMRIALDLANNYPVMVLAYSQLGKTLRIQGWTGTKWVGIRTESYKEGTFFKVGPDRAILIESEDVPLPEQLVPPTSWCPASTKISTAQPRVVLHLLGRYFDFPYEHWKWFAGRYGFTLDEINPEGLNIHWYHRRLDENLFHKRAYGNDDIQFWVPLTEAIVPVVEVPVLEEPESKDEKASELETETKAESKTESGTEAEILSAHVPPAVVLGPPKAEPEVEDSEKK